MWHLDHEGDCSCDLMEHMESNYFTEDQKKNVMLLYISKTVIHIIRRPRGGIFSLKLYPSQSKGLASVVMI